MQSHILAFVSFGILGYHGAASCASPTPEPVFHFDFKDANGKTEVVDLTGTTHCFSASPLVVQNGALHVDFGAKISIPADQVPSLCKPFTLNTWILTSSKGAFGNQPYNPILSKGTSGPTTAGLEFILAIQDGLPTFFQGASGANDGGLTLIGMSYGGTTRYGDPAWVKSKPDVPNETWTFLTVVREEKALRIFLNGRCVLEKPTVSSTGGVVHQPLMIGSERLKGERENKTTANMLVNDFSFYDVALGQSAIEALYESEKDKYVPGQVSLQTTRSYFPEVMKEFSYDLDTKLNIVVEYEKNLPPQSQPSGKNCESSLRRGNIVVDGVPVFPLTCYPAMGYLNDQTVRQTSRFVRDFAAADVNLVTASFGYPVVFWNDDETYAWDKVDAAIEEILRANPRALILAGFYATPPPWFAEKYPEELEKYYYNDGNPSAGLRTWPSSAPFTSKKWEELSVKAITAFVRHAEAQPYAEHIYGYLIASGDSAEWYWPGTFAGGFTGYSLPTATAFRAWLRNIYGSDQALQEAWMEKTAVLDQAPVPSPAERTATERWIFRDAGKTRKTLDFRAFMNDTTTSILKKSLHAAKDASGWKKVVATYYGYPLLFAGKGATLHKGGIEDLSAVFGVDALDILVTPADYVHRRGGEPGMNINAFTGSARLHQKMVWQEDDLRTHFWPRMEFGRTEDSHETVGVIRRDFGSSLSNEGAGMWLFAMAGNAAFHENAMMEAVKQVAGIASRSVNVDRKSCAEVAFVFDEKSLRHLSAKPGTFIDDHCWGVYESMSRMGAPFDCYLMEDLDKMPDYKVYLFPDAYALDETTIRKIQNKVRRNNAVSVWSYAPGYISKNGFDASAMKNLTGIEIKDDLREAEVTLERPKSTHPILKYAKKFRHYTFGPLFFVEDVDAVTLATADGRSALAVKENLGSTPGESWRSIYSLMPLTKELLMGICDYAGVHVYSRSFDVFRANRSYLMLHTVAAGKKTISLPGKYDVFDELSGKKIASAALEFSEEVEPKETRIYRVISCK